MARRVAAKPKRRRPMAARLELVVPFADTLILFGAGISLCCLTFLFFQLIRGDIGVFPNSPLTGQLLSKPEQDAVVRNVIYATRLFTIATWAAVLLALARHAISAAAVWVPAVAGATVYLLIPMLVALMLHEQGWEGNELTRHWMATFHMTGKVLIVVAVLRGVAGLLLSIVERPSVNLSFGLKRQRAKPIEIQRTGLLPACWQLVSCREPRDKATCLRHLERKSCWKKKSGCVCERKVAETVSKVAVGWTVAETESQMWRLVQLRQAGLNPCKECEIYEEHQHYKYRLLNWLAYPAGVGITVLMLPYIDVAYEWSNEKLAYLAQNMAFLPTAKTSQALEPFVNNVLHADVEWIIIVSVGILLVSLLLDLLEKAIYVWKL